MDILTEFINERTLSNKLKPMQLEAIDAILQNKNAIVVFPTGGGKSLCYQLPSLFFDEITVVISPLISLINDQTSELLKIGIPCANYYNDTIKLLYCTPESLLGKLGETLLLNKHKVSRFVFDEAHCIITWGNDFRTSYLDVCKLINKFSVPVTVLSATLNNNQIRDICYLLNITDPVIIKDNNIRNNLEISIVEKSKGINVTQQIISLLKKTEGSTIIYCFSKKECETLSEKINNEGILSLVFHSETKDKRNVLDNFKTNQVRVVVATIAFGLGINKPDVRMIIHKDMPKSIDSYYQEIGRAGRDGLPSKCVCYFNYSDLNKQQQLETKSTISLSMYNFCKEVYTCRLQQLTYLLDLDECTPCNKCDTCTFEYTRADITNIVANILQLVRFDNMNKNELIRKLDNKDVINTLISKRLIDEIQVLCKNGYYTQEIAITELGINQIGKQFYIYTQTKEKKKERKQLVMEKELLTTLKAINPSTPELLTKIKGMPDIVDDYVQEVFDFLQINTTHNQTNITK